MKINATSEAKSSKLNSPLTIIFITVFIDMLGFGLIIPVLPFYAEHYGATPFTVGMMAMSFSLMHLLFSPIWGRLSDKYGRRPMILGSLIGTSIAFCIFGLAPSLVWLFVARIITGITTSASLPAAQAFVADSTPPDQRAKGMGFIGAAFGLGFIFGPVMGGMLSQFGYGVPAFAAAGLATCNFIWAYFRLPESLKQKNVQKAEYFFAPAKLKEIIGNPKLAFLLSIFFLHIFAFANMESTFALLSEHQIGLGAFGVGALLGEVGIISALIQGLLIGKITAKFGEISMAIAGTLCMAMGLFLTGLVQTLPQMIAVVPFYAIGMAITNPALNSLISRSAPANQQGSTMGLAQGVGGLGRTLGPIVGTGLFQAFSPATPYFIGSAILAISWLICLFKLRKTVEPAIAAS